jgi:hypothetical protein
MHQLQYHSELLFAEDVGRSSHDPFWGSTSEFASTDWDLNQHSLDSNRSHSECEVHMLHLCQPLGNNYSESSGISHFKTCCYGFWSRQYVLEFIHIMAWTGRTMIHCDLHAHLNISLLGYTAQFKPRPPPFFFFLEVSHQFSFSQDRVVSPTSNPQPGGPGFCIYIPQRQGGPVIPPGIRYPF